MPTPREFLLGEFPRKLDERFRISLPPELADPLVHETLPCLLVKERPGCLSLWNPAQGHARLEAAVEVIRQKMHAGKLEGRLADVQRLGRLLSTRHRSVELAARSRLVIPEGFREFLAAEPGETVMVLGAAVCVELWQPAAWSRYLERRIGRFGRLLDRLSS